jgi:hypothetical protein
VVDIDKVLPDKAADTRILGNGVVGARILIVGDQTFTATLSINRTVNNGISSQRMDIVNASLHDLD